MDMDCTLVSETMLLKLKKQEQKGEESPSKICFVLFLFFCAEIWKLSFTKEKSTISRTGGKNWFIVKRSFMLFIAMV